MIRWGCRGISPPRPSRMRLRNSSRRPRPRPRRQRPTPTSRRPKTRQPTTWSPSLPTPTTPTAYNNWLMTESYLLVPLNGLPADKALALAQFIRFAVGGRRAGGHHGTRCRARHLGHGDRRPRRGPAAQCRSGVGNVHDVNDDHDHEHRRDHDHDHDRAAAATGTGASPGASTSPGSSSGGLAVTGDDPLPLVGLGLALLICGEGARQLLRRRKAKT